MSEPDVFVIFKDGTSHGPADGALLTVDVSESAARARKVGRCVRYVPHERLDFVRVDLIEAVAKLPRCRCGAIATHEAYDATSDGQPACADCLPAFANGMDGQDTPRIVAYVEPLQRALSSLSGT